MLLLFLFTGTITLSIGINLLLTLTGITASSASMDAGAQIQTALTGIGLGLSVALYGIVAPLCEELLFRGVLYNMIDTYVRRRGAVGTESCSLRAFLIAAICSSLLFALYHGNLAQGIYAFLMGMTFCLAYELTGQFLSAWILHAACNIIALLLSQPVNGTNAFTQLCTLPWTAAFLAAAAAAFVCLHRTLREQGSSGY